MTTATKYEAFLSHFHIAKRQGDKAICHCPIHDDKCGSLHFTLDRDKILGYCFAGCQIADILAAKNLNLRDLFLDGQHSPEAIYQYRNKDGSFLSEKVKYRNTDGTKDFKQRQLTADGRIVYNLEGISRVPYNYLGVIKAIKNGEAIIYPEGEKDAETARILGYTGTTVGGASDWKDEWKGFFCNARIVQTADNDKAGITLVQKISKSLCEVAQSVKVVIIPEGKDLTEWVTLGHGRADLDKLIAEAPELVKSKRGFNWRDFAISHDDLLDKELPPVEYLVEDLLTTPGTAVLAGRKKIGKSWLSLQLSQCIASGSPFLGKTTRQGKVIHLSLEDGERRLKQRLEMQNATKGLPVIYISKFEPLNTKAGFEALQELIKAQNPRLVVIDTLASAKNRFLDENEAGSTADLFNQLHELAITQNCVILVIAHHGKQSHGDVGFDIRGSSAISGATDTNLGLYKNTDGTFDLKAEGRDIGEVDLRIGFDAEVTWCWQCKGDARDVRRAEAEDRILEAIALLGGEADATAIAKEIDIARPTVATHLKRMREQSIVGYRTVNTGKASKILYIYPLTDPTNLQPIIQSVGSVGTVGDSKNEGVDTLTPLTDADKELLSNDKNTNFLKTFSRKKLDNT